MKPGNTFPKAPLVLCLFLSVLTLGLPACSTVRVPSPSPYSRDVLHQEEWQALQHSDSYHVIQRLRPWWLSGRRAGSFGRDTRNVGESQVRIYVDGILSSQGVGHLKAIAAQDVLEIRHLSPIDATLRFGINHGAGAILVTTRAGIDDPRT